MNQLPHSLAEVKVAFGPGAASLEFSEVDGSIGIRPQGGRRIERPEWLSLFGIVKKLGGRYMPESKVWVVPLAPVPRPEPPQTTIPAQPPSKWGQGINEIAKVIPNPPYPSVGAHYLEKVIDQAEANERKFAIENLNRVLEEVPQRKLEWSEEALATVARGMLLLLEEKK